MRNHSQFDRYANAGRYQRVMSSWLPFYRESLDRAVANGVFSVRQSVCLSVSLSDTLVSYA